MVYYPYQDTRRVCPRRTDTPFLVRVRNVFFDNPSVMAKP